MSREITCCFTGHRHLGSDFKKENLKGAIENLIEKGVKIFIAGGALGFDTEAALEVLRQKKAGKDVALHIYAPCNNQAVRFSFKEKWIYKKILKHADYVDMPPQPYFNGCMKIRNYKMVDASSYVIAYYTGEFKSGTGQTVRYAQRSGLEITNLCTNLKEDF
ncbi:MAG: DUF1273 family protein [Clostridia bacterium]|nr:DUF1273 family protein [Clostridia bacterium]